MTPRKFHILSSLRAIIVVCAALALLAAASLWIFRRSSHPPVWREELARVPLLGPVDPNIRSSVWLQEQNVRFRNDVLRRQVWGVAEVDEVIGALEQAPQDYLVTDETEYDSRFERSQLAQAAAQTIRVRIGSGAPIEPVQRERLVDALLARSRSVDPFVRHGVVEALCWTGLIFEDPRVDARVVEMMEDPDPMVAMNAKRQYRWHSSNRDKYESYQQKLGRE